MAFPVKIRFIYWCCLCLVLCISGNTVTSSSFEIQRGKVDTFTNLGCQKSNNCTEKRCAEYEAKCVDDKCERCQCKEDSATFLARNTTTIITYKCVKDENVLPESDLQFRLEKINKTDKRTNQCLTVVAVEQNYKIFGKSCNSSLNMHWIWTKKENKFFLMNLMTLQCLEFLQCNQNTTKVILKQCKKTDRRQYIIVQVSSPGRIFSKCGGKNYYLRLEEQESDVGYSSFGEKIVRSQTKDLDRWTNSKKDDLHLSNKPTTYNGCYRFQNEKFMLYLDRETCRENPCSHQFFAPIFYENAICDVIWSESKILYGDNVQWQNISSKENISMSISENGNHELSNIKMLKVYQNALNIFNGSLVRLAISCENEKNGNQNSIENQCLLLKFKSLSRTEEEILTKTPSPALTTTLTPRSTIQKTSLTKSSINTIVIAVPVSLLAVILIVTLFYFIRCYRKQKRSVPSKNTENPVTDENSSPMVEELVESTNPPNNNSQSTPNQSQLYAKPHSQHEYQYVDAKDRTFALQPRSPKYEIPQSPTYEYPERPQSQQYEYPSLGKPILKETVQQDTDTTGIYTDTVGVDSGYTPLIRRPVNNDDDSGYAHLKDVKKRNEKTGARERSDKLDGLLDAMDGKVTPLKNTCEDSSNARGQLKTNDEQSAKRRKDAADESPYVVPMDSHYTALVRPPVRNGEREDPGYESLIKNRK